MESIIARQRERAQARKRREDPAIAPVWRQRVEALGGNQGYKTVSCPFCDRLIWTKTEIVEPNLHDEALRAFEVSSRESGHPYTDVYDSPEMHQVYYDLVEELGKKQDFQNFRCPHCALLLWSKSEIFEAKL